MEDDGEKSQRRGNKSNFSPRQPAVSSVVKSPIKLAGVFSSGVRIAAQLRAKMFLDSWETKREAKR